MRLCEIPMSMSKTELFGRCGPTWKVNSGSVQGMLLREWIHLKEAHKAPHHTPHSSATTSQTCHQAAIHAQGLTFLKKSSGKPMPSANTDRMRSTTGGSACMNSIVVSLQSTTCAMKTFTKDSSISFVNAPTFS